MKTYTMSFPDPANSSMPLPPDFTLGTPILFDGLALSTLPNGQKAIAFGDRPVTGNHPWALFFDPERPPEVIKDYVLETDLLHLQREVFLRQSGMPVRQREETAGPLLARLHTRCASNTKLHGTIKVFAGSPKLITSGCGDNSAFDQNSGLWYDSLYQLNPGDILQIRPAGLEMVLDWLLVYSQIGLNFKPLSAHVA